MTFRLYSCLMHSCAFIWRESSKLFCNLYSSFEFMYLFCDVCVFCQTGTNERKKRSSFSKKLPFMKSRERSGSEDGLSGDEGEQCRDVLPVLLSRQSFNRRSHGYYISAWFNRSFEFCSRLLFEKPNNTRTVNIIIFKRRHFVARLKYALFADSCEFAKV